MNVRRHRELESNEPPVVEQNDVNGEWMVRVRRDHLLGRDFGRTAKWYLVVVAGVVRGP